MPDDPDLTAGLVEGWIRLWLELVSALSARFGCAAVPVQRPVLVLVLLGGPGSVQPWAMALAPVLVRGARPLLGLLRSGLLRLVVE